MDYDTALNSKDKTIQRFMAKVGRQDSSIENTCWVWLAFKRDTGYGHFKAGGRFIKAHRFAYQTFVGEIPSGLCVLHNCDNPSCVNPSHLRVGTHQDNMADMVARRRHNPNRGDSHYTRIHPEKVLRGERNGGSKIPDNRIDDIFKWRKEGLTQQKIASRLNVDRSTIGYILRHKLRAKK